MGLPYECQRQVRAPPAVYVPAPQPYLQAEGIGPLAPNQFNIPMSQLAAFNPNAPSTTETMGHVVMVTLPANGELNFSLAQNASPMAWKVLHIEKADLNQQVETFKFLNTIRWVSFNIHPAVLYYEKCPGWLKVKPVVFWNDDIMTIWDTYAPYARGPLILYRNNKTHISEKYTVRGSHVSFTTKDILTFLHYIERSPQVAQYLAHDVQLQTSDKYLLGTVFFFLKGAGIDMNGLNLTNFFGALMLANDLLEDEPIDAVTVLLNQTFMRHAPPDVKRAYYQDLRFSRWALFNNLGHYTHVTSDDIEKLVQVIPTHPLWRRLRSCGNN